MMTRVVIFAFVAISIAFSLVGCATVALGTKQSISITSNVDGATIYLDGQQIGRTPFQGEVSRNKKTLRIESDGYVTETVVLSKSLEPIFWGNIIIGGTVGSSTDFASGAAYSYAPATYQVELQAERQSSIEFQQQLMVRKFCMVYIDELSRDVAGGDGEYLTALLSLVNDESDGKVDSSNIRDALVASHGDPVCFGDAVVELL